ncbi:MAG TPA: hypothetical protein VGM26_00985 [Rhizomicrobium sp.]|jgi:hypothetical protein
MSMVDPIGPAPETRTVRFLWLLFGASAAPLFWLGQLLLSYAITAHVCYPGDHPETLQETGPLLVTLIVFDVIALAASAGGALVSWRLWQRGEDRHSERQFTLHVREVRARFLALWGVMSSIWFFFAILFNVIASVTVPPCAG